MIKLGIVYKFAAKREVRIKLVAFRDAIKIHGVREFSGWWCFGVHKEMIPTQS